LKETCDKFSIFKKMNVFFIHIFN